MKRKISILGDVVNVPLPGGLVAIVDLVDAHLVDGYNWYYTPGRKTNYAQRQEWLGNGRRRSIYMHRLVLGNPDGMVVDHIDGNGLNNRRSNLRIATQNQNKRNSALFASNTSGLKGVSWHKKSLKWRAQIGHNNKKIHLGSFDAKEDAHAAYCEAAIKYHGEFWNPGTRGP